MMAGKMSLVVFASSIIARTKGSREIRVHARMHIEMITKLIKFPFQLDRLTRPAASDLLLPGNREVFHGGGHAALSPFN